MTDKDLPVFITEHRDDIIRIAAELEGHFDNVAASVFGGIVAASPQSTVVVPVSAQVLEEIRVVAWVPFFKHQPLRVVQHCRRISIELTQFSTLPVQRKWSLL